ncbi:hypothetical protein OH77DRAFT_1429569 [Trametes cingulata]|nr:hypothetical protein OH77DRAFT_1429569 [Trametes cingulata]
MTIEDPPWKKRTRPCPFYSQGRCLFADSCNFMHSVKIRRPDSVVGSEDSDQPDFRLVVDSPSAARAVRFKSPPRSPRRTSLLMALGDIISQDEEEGEWEEEESGEQESCSGEGSSEGRPSGEYAEPPAALQDIDQVGDGSLIFSAGEVDTPAPHRSMLGLSEEPEQPLTDEPAPEEELPQELDASLLGDTTLVDSFSPRSASPSAETSVLEDEETTVRLRRAIIPEFPLPPARVPSPRRSSASSGLLSPIEITPAPPISLPRHATVAREESFDSGYADGPVPLCLSPPRSPHRMSTLSILSSPFGSPSARVLRFDPTAAPAAALFSPRFGTFPSNLQQDQAAVESATGEPRHGRGDSVDSLDFSEGLVSGVVANAEESDFDLFATAVAQSPTLSATQSQQLSVPEGSSLFRAVHSPVYPPVPEETLRPGEPSFGEDDTMTSLYDQYYTPTIHTAPLQPPPAQDATPATLVDSHSTVMEPTPEAGPSSARSLSPHLSSPQRASSSPISPRPLPSQAVSGRAVSSPAPSARSNSRLSSRSAEHPHVFSPPSNSGSAIGLAMLQESHSPAISVKDEDAHIPAEGSVRSASSMSVRTEDSQGQLVSRKVPFGFRQSVSDRSQLSARSSVSAPPSRVLRVRPPPLVGVGKEAEKPETGASATTPFSPTEPPSATSSAGPGRLKPLRLSMILSSSSSLGSSVPSATHPPSLTTATTATTTYTPSSPTVSSEYSLSNNRLLSSPRSSIIPPRIRNTHGSTTQLDSPLHITPVISHSQPASAPASRPPSWQQRFSKRRSLLVQPSRRLSYLSEHHARSDSRLSEPIDESREDDFDEYDAADRVDETIRRPVSSLSATQPRPESILLTPVHAIATPRPTLLFALASDDVEEVRRVLESGEARPNDDVGPQSALAFTLASNQLKNKMAMVKLLLAYGADASALRDVEEDEDGEQSSKRGSRPMSKLLEDADPATRYYIERANSPQTRRASALIHRSFFRPLTRVRYDLIGQDRVIEQLFRVLSMPSMAPTVVLLCGPSGHGKSLLARKFGSLLDVPTHTVNMTTLQNTRDIWRSHSIDPHEEPSDRSLKDFLMENEGRRCVVVLDEIEKAQDEKILSSLLMPWEYGRCSFEAGHRHVDVSKVIWLGTSNIGHDLVFEHQDNRPAPETQLSREEYIDLMALLRPRVSERLGASLLSRVTVVLPFVAFTTDEKLAIAAEALYALAGEAVRTMPPATRDMIVRSSLNSYIPSEGARSLYRAVSSQLLDTI